MQRTDGAGSHPTPCTGAVVEICDVIHRGHFFSYSASARRFTTVWANDTRAFPLASDSARAMVSLKFKSDAAFVSAMFSVARPVSATIPVRTSNRTDSATHCAWTSFALRKRDRLNV